MMESELLYMEEIYFTAWSCFLHLMKPCCVLTMEKWVSVKTTMGQQMVTAPGLGLEEMIGKIKNNKRSLHKSFFLKNMKFVILSCKGMCGY